MEGNGSSCLPVKQRMFRWNTRWISVTEYPLSVKEYPRSNAFFPVPDTAKVSTTAISADDCPRGIYKMAGEDNQMLSGQDSSADVHMRLTSGCP